MRATLYPALAPLLPDESLAAPSDTAAAAFFASVPSTPSSASPTAQLALAGQLLCSATLLSTTTKSSSSSSLLSLDSSSPSSSSPSAGLVPPLSTAPTSRRRYQRLTGLTLEQRIERRRHSHRELDAARRQCEASVIDRLEQLTASHVCTDPLAPPALSDSPLSETGTALEHKAERRRSGRGGKSRLRRTTVLERSVQRIEELQQLVRHLTATCAQQSREVATLRLQQQSTDWEHYPSNANHATQTVSLLSASSIRRLVAELGPQSLYSAMFVSPSVGLVLVACSSGIAVDVNERLLSFRQCMRENIIGRQVCPTYDVMVTRSDWDSDPAASQQLQTGGRSAILFSRYTQYGATKESVLAMSDGQVDQINVMWRAQLGDGLAYEVPLSSFVASRDEMETGRPRTVLVALSMSEAKRI